MAAPAKFLFDVDFGTPDKTRERPSTPAEVAQKVAAAEGIAYRNGYDAGQREAKAESDRRAALALEEIKIAMQGIAARFAAIELRMETASRSPSHASCAASSSLPSRSARSRALSPTASRTSSRRRI
jgi:hypothetical protein